MQSDIFRATSNASASLFAFFIAFVIASMFISNNSIRQLKELSIRDPLTNLYNTGFMYEMIPTILRTQKRLRVQVLAVTFIDVDHFKKINDTFWNAHGDKVLRQLATIRTANTRPKDYCILYGGEEFIIIGFYKDKAAVLNAAERL